MSRYKPVGWRRDSHRHYLAAKYGSAGGRRYMSYAPSYVAGDLPLIGADALGTVGAEAVALIPVVVPVVLAYGVAKVAKKKGYFAQRRYMKFTKDTTIPAVEHPNSFKYNVLVRKQLMSPQAALDEYERMAPGIVERFSESFPRTVERAVKAHEQGRALTAPVIYYEKKFGFWVPEAHDHFEHALAAKRVGEDQIPVVKVYKRPQDKDGKYILTPEEKRGFELQEQAMNKAPMKVSQEDNVIRLSHENTEFLSANERAALDDANVYRSLLIDEVPDSPKYVKGREKWDYEKDDADGDD